MHNEKKEYLWKIFDLVIIIVRKVTPRVMCRKYGKGRKNLWERTDKNKETRRNVFNKITEETILPHCVFLVLLLKINRPYMLSFISGLYSVTLVYISVFMSASYF